MSSPTSSPTSSLARLCEGKRRRQLLTESLEGFFTTMNPYKHGDNGGDSPSASPFSSPSNCHKNVRFESADNARRCHGHHENEGNHYYRCQVPFLEFSSSTRSLTSIPEESISLDSTQHCRTDLRDPSPLEMMKMTPRMMMASLDETNHSRSSSRVR